MHDETRQRLHASRTGRSSRRALSPYVVDEYAMTRSEVRGLRAGDRSPSAAQEMDR